MSLRAAAALAALLLPCAALAELPADATALADPAPASRSAPLTLAEVLASSRKFQPLILEAIARVRAAEGKRLAAEGAFDTNVQAEGSARLSGFYDGSYASGQISRPIENWGGSYYGGYRVSGGRFPIYEDKNYTNVLGELRAGAVLALMRDRRIDERRFNRGNAALDVEIAEAERLAAAIGVQRRAVAAYNQWVAAGLRLEVYRDLLGIARARQAGLQRQVEEGARPRIILTENAQNILRRETLVARAEQDLAQAANTLSLFWRDADGLPRKPQPAQLPSGFPTFAIPAGPTRQALAGRPDLRAIDLRLNQTANRLALDRNALLPRLDVKVEASQDLGPIGEGGRSRNGFESIVGLNFSVPLERRAARGRIAQTTAEIDAITRRKQATEEQIVAEIEGIAIDVRASAQLEALAAQERDRARELASAEQRRFGAGASDFFLVNTREETAADAAVRALDARYRNIVASADLAAAAADLGALGLD